ncbi:hypothetical protein BpHYR1_036516 [Brachionus plicatilis]|uniref:Uncharacterized protein n=1 Tax=Brachionus plicatilis TaxID=10195 RepID=A0A3M7SC70_BRAPC|nr:hypothetical protein BpHYR1_036516 [Brachionus plicatilis]
MNDDFYYNPADFEDKPAKGSKTEFKKSFEATTLNQSQKTGLNNFKTKINYEDKPKPEPTVETYEPRGFRGQRNQRGRYSQQTNNKPYENKQVYNPNDFNFELGEDPNKASKMNDDFYYNPADFEDKPAKGSKTEFKKSFEATILNQSQNRNSANKNFNNKIDYPSNQYEPNMTFNRSQSSQQGYSNNNYQNYEQQPNYGYNNRDDYGYYYDEYSNNQYNQEPRYQRGNNDYRQNSGSYGRSQNFHRRNY